MDDFKINYLLNKEFRCLSDKSINHYLLKWSMNNRLKLQSFSFDYLFLDNEKDNFFKVFFNNPTVSKELMVISPEGKNTTLSEIVNSEINVKVEKISCTQTSFSFFDKLLSSPVVSSDGSIITCQEDFTEGWDAIITDELQKMILKEDSNNFKLFTPLEKNEFLFLLFKHFVLGGALCQSEHIINPYLDITKKFYHELISVAQVEKTIKIISLIYKVKCYANENLVYPSSKDHIQDFAYFIVTPEKKIVNIVYHNFGVALPSIK